MKIIETYIVRWIEDDGYDYLCKVYYLEDRQYIRESDNGKRTIIESISKEEFFKQKGNSIK